MQFICKQWCGNFLKSSCIIFLLYQVWKSSKSPSQNWMALYNLYHCASIRVIFAKFVPTKEIWYLSDCVTLRNTLVKFSSRRVQKNQKSIKLGHSFSSCEQRNIKLHFFVLKSNSFIPAYLDNSFAHLQVLSSLFIVI